MRLEGDRSDEICINLFIDAWRRGNEGAGEERGRMNGCWFWMFFLEGSQNVWRLGCNLSYAFSAYFNFFEGDVSFPPFCFLVEVCLFKSGKFIGGGGRRGEMLVMKMMMMRLVVKSLGLVVLFIIL